MSYTTVFPVNFNLLLSDDGSAQPLRFGIPFAPGQCLNVSDVSLWQQDQPLRQQCQISSYWPDGSIRWLLADVMTNAATTAITSSMTNTLPDGRGTIAPAPLQLRQGKAPIPPAESDWQLQTSAQQIQLTNSATTTQPLRLSLRLQQGTAPLSFLHAQFAAAERLQQGAVLTEYRVLGHFAGLPLRLELFIRCYPDGLLQIHTSLHNPQRARHQGGLWDLGDAGSVLFHGLELEIDWLAGADELKLSADSPSQQLADGWSLQQLGSGGDQWQSDNHRTADGPAAITEPGFVLLHHEAEPNNRQTGRRASPQLRRLNDGAVLCLTPAEFWQNFPSSLSAQGALLRLGLFAPGQQYELQGGERKTQHCWLRLSQEPAATLSWPLQPALVQMAQTQSPVAPIAPIAQGQRPLNVSQPSTTTTTTTTTSTNYYQQALAMPWLSDSQTSDYDLLLQPSLDQQRGFVAKRELIDEFGWRNFGDIFADHESLYLAKDQPPYISHYNNQYDPVYGFCRQYLRTGDRRWFQLMDELARHVSDIDIYHTDQDRAEYNHGLFWHTDHYLPAHSCTHRTYSKHNSTSSIPGQTGGGPANEHCYSTGLLYHFWLTGNPQSKQAVLELADWMINAHEGAAGLLSRLWSIKLRELPKLQALWRGNTTNPYRYPFTRGTGNYLNTLLDAYELSCSAHYLQLAEQVLRDCIHPNDDIAARQLDNVEVAWSYLVLLGVLPRYLRLKTITAQQDAMFELMAAAFYRYSCWLAEHEQPFLTKPEQLEFPNDTWTAQDMRKVMLLRQAAQFFPQHASQFQSTADRWYQWLLQRLASSSELEFARVQVLLLLLHGPQQQDDTSLLALAQIPVCTAPAPGLHWSVLLRRIVKTVLKGIIELRPARERQWLKNRINS